MKKITELNNKYRTANIVRFVAEVLFAIGILMFFFATTHQISSAFGPPAIFISFISIIVAISYEIRRYVLKKKIIRKKDANA